MSISRYPRCFHLGTIFSIYIILIQGSSFGKSEEYFEQPDSLDSLWYSVEDLRVPIPDRDQIVPSLSSYRYAVNSTIAEFPQTGSSYIRVDDQLLKHRVDSESTIIAFRSEYILSKVRYDSLYCDIDLEDFYEIEQFGGTEFSTVEFVSYVSNSDLIREQFIIYSETDLYSVSLAAVSAHYHEASYEHNRQGYLDAKHHLTSSYGSYHMYSYDDSRAIEIEKLTQESSIDFDRWIRLNIAFDNQEGIWGERSDSVTTRNATFARSSALERILPDNIGQFISQETSNFQRVTEEWESIFSPRSTHQDTVEYVKNIYYYIHPDERAANPELRRGVIFMVPVAGKLACSLFVGSTPTLEEFAWASVDAAMITGSILWWRHVPSNGLADDIALRVREASTSTPSYPIVVERPSTHALRGVLEAAGRQTGPGQIHHIVSLRDRAANVSRQILERYGVDLNSAINLVPLSNHCGRHSADYYRSIESILRGATSKADVYEALNTIRGSLSSGVLAL